MKDFPPLFLFSLPVCLIFQSYFSFILSSFSVSLPLHCSPPLTLPPHLKHLIIHFPSNITLSIFLQTSHYLFSFKHHIIHFSFNITLSFFFKHHNIHFSPNITLSIFLFFSLEWDLHQQQAVLGAQRMSVHKLILTSKVQEK